MAETLDGLKVRIRELEKEVERWKSQVKSVRYGLNWMDVPEAFDKDSEDKIPILEEVTEKAVDADGPLAGRPPHVIIEGDNYHALTCLNYTHRGKIDVIYIDPPYNTGSDGFTYKDARFLTEFPDGQKIPKEHPLRHSSWLSFMEKRLKLAKNLLSETGVIFVSIDDNEQANLKLLCDKIFGESNFVVNFIWRGGKRNMSKWVSTSHEYMLTYAKNINQCAEKNVEWFEAKLGLPEIYSAAKQFIKEAKDNYIEASKKLKKWYKSLPDAHPSKDHDHYCWIDKRGVYFASDISRGGGGGPQWKIKNPYTNEFVKTPQRGWAYSKIEELQDDIKKDLIHFNGDGVPCRKIYLEDNETQILDSVFYKDRRGSSKRLKNLMGAEVFPFPKDEFIIQDKLKSFTLSNSIVLDFFAGSGTTLHSILNLNKSDGGKRQCILVQAPEKTFVVKDGKKTSKKGSEKAFENGYMYISEVTYERNRRVMCGYTSISAQGKQTEVEGLGGSLKYYKTGFVGKHQSKKANDADKVELAEKAGCLIALAENTLETIKVPKAAKGFWQIYSDNAEKKKRYTCIYHNGDYGKVSDFVAKIDELRATDKKSKFMVYVFSWNSPDFFENEFDDLKNIEIKAIPKPILEIYKALNG